MKAKIIKLLFPEKVVEAKLEELAILIKGENNDRRRVDWLGD